VKRGGECEGEGGGGGGGGRGCSNPKTLHQGEVQIFSGTTQASKVFHLRDKGRGMVLG